MKQRQHGSKYEGARKLGKVGSYSYCVTIPKVIIEDLRRRKGQRVVVSQDGDIQGRILFAVAPGGGGAA